MALCGYCGKVEIAWWQQDRKWIACEAQRDAEGNVMRGPVRAGTKTVMRPLPDITKRHYPHVTPDVPLPTECQDWTRAKAAARPKRGRRGSMAGAGWTPAPAPAAAPTTTPAPAPVARPATPAAPMSTAAAIPTATLPTAAPAASVAPKSAALPTPESLMTAEALAAWKRAKRILCSTAVDAKSGSLIASRLLLWGPPGTGKTQLPWNTAAALGWTHFYQLMTEETPASELLGHLIVQGGSTVWCDGSVGRAIRASHDGPVVLTVDEIGRASQDAMSACLLLLTNPESLRLTLRSGEVIAPNPANWRVVCTSNSEPSMLDPALQDRLHLAVRLVSPNPELIASMVTAEARRLACSASREYSVRALLTYDRLRAAGMSAEDACGITFEPEVAKSFLDALSLATAGRA